MIAHVLNFYMIFINSVAPKRTGVVAENVATTVASSTRPAPPTAPPTAPTTSAQVNKPVSVSDH